MCRRTVSSVKGRARLLEEAGQRRRRRAGRFSPGEDERIIRTVLHHNPASLQVRVLHCTALIFALRHFYIGTIAIALSLSLWHSYNSLRVS